MYVHVNCVLYAMSDLIQLLLFPPVTSYPKLGQCLMPDFRLHAVCAIGL